MKNQLPFETIKREILTKKESETDSSYGCKPEERPVDVLINYGVVNINKPKGPTSHQVAEYVQKILCINKAGHSGTLDPAVTGVLPMALGRATRIVQTLLPAGKEYVGIMHLHKPVDKNKIKKVLDEFVGSIKQLPPIKSAVKRQVRERKIYYIEVLEIEEQDVLFRIGCQAGTYIRKFCHDVGKKLKVGGHMAQLMRTKAGPFTEKDMVTLQELSDSYWLWKKKKDEGIKKYIKPVEEAIPQVPKVWILDNAADTVCHGSDLKTPGISKLNTGIKKGDTVAIMSLKDELIALGIADIASDEMIEKERGIAVKTHKVFMETGTYPKFNK
ncbi:RNA-guided pseudouridylation complex pseudouridine synthase subunit Cbf5 [Candidatus Woesearchaeota archaeon]|nr:RNA-guided pseudouridylation complex pseudouridine synthase subunit Cbf5 [Candidatus Woesearchaeota archaeon]MBW3005326.1 RNA-guided pseudouridylation complex pseudouridine synthase subunit Cbf5 [Candidatus Woesearchaeota archaeon]